MAFGFPAYHEVTNFDIPAGVDMPQSMMSTLRELGWGPSFDANGIIATTSANLRSWGERIIVTISEGTISKIRSECSLATQCVDYGKNQKNIERILSELPKHYVHY